MKTFVATAILALAALWTTTASAQVYGGETDPYQQNPFGSNSYVAPPPEPPATPATPAPAPRQDAGKPQQTTASTAKAPEKKQTP